MKTFCCDECGSRVFFENVKCVNCGRSLGFLPDAEDLSALEFLPDEQVRALSPAVEGRLYRLCQNGREHEICNWLVEAEDKSSFCVSCRLNKTIPDLSQLVNLPLWQKIEKAKRRLVYTLLHLKLRTDAAPERNVPALQFSFLADAPGGPPVITGHVNGLITLNIAEADDAERERRRVNLREPYRTLLGHFRHEVAHYYWDRLIAKSPRLPLFREMFGDETRDYGTALATYYQQGAPPDWQERHVSAYASAHPWEDWAETWAHYLHMVDTIQTAGGFGLTLSPLQSSSPVMSADPTKIVDPSVAGFDQVLENWLPLTYALNSLNRGMGLPDLYPFVLPNVAIEKLRFIHNSIQEVRQRQGQDRAA